MVVLSLACAWVSCKNKYFCLEGVTLLNLSSREADAAFGRVVLLKGSLGEQKYKCLPDYSIPTELLCQLLCCNCICLYQNVKGLLSLGEIDLCVSLAT